MADTCFTGYATGVIEEARVLFRLIYGTVAHKIIIASYHIIKDKVPCKEPELNPHPKKRNKQIKNYLNRLKQLGVDLSMEEIEQKSEDRFFTEQAQLGLSRL